MRYEEQNYLLSKFPKIELSYEKRIHKNVHNDYAISIPKGSKFFAWFKNYKGKIKVPFLFLQASADKVVKPKPQEDFCKKMKGSCKFIRIENSKHEILMEKDLVRNKALRLINHFFNGKL